MPFRVSDNLATGFFYGCFKQSPAVHSCFVRASQVPPISSGGKTLTLSSMSRTLATIRSSGARMKVAGGKPLTPTVVLEAGSGLQRARGPRLVDESIARIKIRSSGEPPNTQKGNTTHKTGSGAPFRHISPKEPHGPVSYTHLTLPTTPYV